MPLVNSNNRHMPHPCGVFYDWKALWNHIIKTLDKYTQEDTKFPERKMRWKIITNHCNNGMNLCGQYSILQRLIFPLCFTCPPLAVQFVQEEAALPIVSKRLEQPLESDGCDFLAAFVADVCHFKIGFAITPSPGKTLLDEFWPGLAWRNSNLNKRKLYWRIDSDFNVLLF